MTRLLILLILGIFMLSSCVWDKDAAILLSDEPIVPEEFEFKNQMPRFKPGQRIYYILLSKKPIENPKLRLQVLRIEYKSPHFKVEPIYAVDINRGEHEHMVTDYFTLHRDGNFFIRIFSHDELKLPIAETEFVVEKL